ncbi:aquaporin-like protein [Phakopsora pachyrhizi]|uniref:Aquaporin-like protein n=1 Tax=Phakopsora pachyrhizi TaxID=170000 RepID=A0AAV0BHG3_PHAPC|nr:aquaporin-like protein [Phakopsora pachyrhizi]CAH7686654.1 aquaporin-like protein [Phakopsora pachyrhizi]
MGLSLLATAWTFFRVCGSVFNPNVAIALLLTGALKPMRFVLYVCAEIVAGIVAAALLKAALPGELAVNCTLGPGVTNGQAVVIEGFLTFALTLTVLFVAVEKHRATAFAPCAIGLVLFATHLFGVIYTGAALNSARAFGPAVLTGFTSYHWVYWVGPSVGALIATAIYYMWVIDSQYILKITIDPV